MSASFSQILGISRSGMQSEMQGLDMISNNLANLQTIGFKSSRMNFQEMLTKNMLSGVNPVSSQISMLPGTIETTTNALDMAVEGAGFFSVKLPDGKLAYTRDGHFVQDGNGTIVNADGLKLNWTGTIPADTEGIEVLEDGTVKAKIGAQWTDAGKVTLTTFPNPNGLTNIGQNLWQESDVSGKAKAGTPTSTGYGKIHGFSLERSNVNLSNEIAHMVRLQRAFDTSVSAVKKTDEMISLAIHMR
jgi:flagellar basal-body rod protein FlgG